MWGQRNDVTGIGPDQFAILQENSLDFSFEIKELYSQLGWPIDIARGKGKITGKAKAARVFANLYADIFFGTTVATSEDNVSENETFTLASASVSVAHASTFVADLGVYYNAASNYRFQYETGAPSATGQYSTGVNGVYTFFSGDIGAAISISYVYTDTSGKTITITNNFMGYTPTFIATFYQNRATQGGSGQMTLRLNECVSSHLTIPSRIDDYAIPDLDFQAFSSGTNVVGTISMTEVKRMFAGTKITIGEETFVVPPLSLGQLRTGVLTKLKEHDALAADGTKFFELMELRGSIILEALRRNYPDFAEEKLFSYLDLANVGPLWNAVLGASGFTLGEAQAATTAKSGT